MHTVKAFSALTDMHRHFDVHSAVTAVLLLIDNSLKHSNSQCKCSNLHGILESSQIHEINSFHVRTVKVWHMAFTLKAEAFGNILV